MFQYFVHNSNALPPGGEKYSYIFKKVIAKNTFKYHKYSQIMICHITGQFSCDPQHEGLDLKHICVSTGLFKTHLLCGWEC